MGWLEANDTVLLVGLSGVTCAISLLAVGTVHVPVVLFVAPLAIVTAALAVWGEGWGLRQLPAAALILLGLAAYTELQAIPLPLALLDWAAPANADVWSRALHGFGEAAPRWATLSLDPGATRVEALKWLAYGAALISGAAIGRRLGARTGASIVFGAAALAAVVTIGHALAGAEKLYGFYEPAFAHPTWGLGPLLNPNNLAGYLNLGAFTGVGLLVASRAPGPRWLLAIAVAATLAVSLLSGSRGGAAGLVVGLVLTIPALRSARRLGRHRVAGRVETGVEIGAVILGTAALFFLAVNREVWRALLQEGAEKLAIAGWTRPMIEDHPWLGIGRGAYETVFPAYDLDHSHMVFQYAENFIAQWISEWGIPVGAGALIALCVALRPSRLRAFRDPVASGALVGVVALLLQNIVDLALEVASVSLALFLLLGALWGGARRHEERTDKKDASPPGDPLTHTDPRSEPRSVSKAPPRTRLLPGLFLAAAAVATAAALSGLSPAVTERQALKERYSASTGRDRTAHETFMRELRSALLRHPSDPHLYLLGALATLRDGGSPLRWVGVAIERDRSSGRPYLVLAEALERAGAKEQALATVRMMLERDAGLLGAAVPLVLRITTDPGEIARATPGGCSGAEALARFAEVRNPRQDAEGRESLLALAIARDGRCLRPRRVDARDLLDALASGSRSARCTGDARARCVARLSEHARVAEEVAPHEPLGVMLRARLLLVEGDPLAAERLLARSCSGFGAPLECLQLRVEAGKEHKDMQLLARAVAEYLDVACREPRACAGAHVFVGNTYAALKEHRAALDHLEQAAFETGDPNAWLRVATAAARAGDLLRSKRAFDRARSGGQRPDPKQLEAARGELMRRALQRSSADAP